MTEPPTPARTPPVLLTKAQADAVEDEMRRLEADPATTVEAMRLFMQCLMPCGHAAGNLLTCPDPPFGCVVCLNAQFSTALAEAREENEWLKARHSERADSYEFVKQQLAEAREEIAWWKQKYDDEHFYCQDWVRQGLEDDVTIDDLKARAIAAESRLAQVETENARLQAEIQSRPTWKQVSDAEAKRRKAEARLSQAGAEVARLADALKVAIDTREARAEAAEARLAQVEAERPKCATCRYFTHEPHWPATGEDAGELGTCANSVVLLFARPDDYSMFTRPDESSSSFMPRRDFSCSLHEVALADRDREGR